MGVKSIAAPEARVRLVFLGAAGVGKTALIRRFLHGSFEARHRRTVEELHALELELEPPGLPASAALRLRLELHDTSGSYSFPAMRRLCILRADAFVLVYSAHEPGSFDEVRRLRDEILEARPGAAVPLLVVANKADLAPAAGGPDGGEVAGLSSVVQREWGVRHVEASAKQGHNVLAIFQQLLGQINVLRGSVRAALRSGLLDQRGRPDGASPAAPAQGSQLRHLLARAGEEDADRHGHLLPQTKLFATDPVPLPARGHHAETPPGRARPRRPRGMNCRGAEGETPGDGVRRRKDAPPQPRGFAE